ncbi:YheE family protein [Bacillus safensis]|uniref:YheE family protein n=1 Tax=Bacillus safensis TaxID=561879 RepID=UPI003983A800
MISHFQWKPLFKKAQLPGWKISFFHNGTHYEGIYHKTGDIEWGSQLPPHEVEPTLKEEIHELMLFHVYD